jgi:hypothetical protein|tara:strand:+ start:287 stop:547 length:261 start_codon:yes stop_codon:yes gene_type:complete
MIASAVYGFVAAILVLVITFMVIILTSRFAKAGYGIMYGSLFIKMVTLSAFTLAVKPYLGDAIIYAAIVLISIMFSNVYLIIKIKQ